MAGDAVGNEFCRPTSVEELGDDIVCRNIEANAEERAALALRLGLSEIESLVADLELKRPRTGPLVHVHGDFEAKVVQICVVSLEPMDVHIREAFDAVYTLAPAEDIAGEQEFSLADKDPPEPVEEGVIDLGEAVVQQLAVALDPYPRRPDAQLPEALHPGKGAASKGDGAFGALRLSIAGEKS